MTFFPSRLWKPFPIWLPPFQLQMIVVITGDCNSNHCKVTGLDIFATRHAKLFKLVSSRLGLVTDSSDQIGEETLGMSQSQSWQLSISVLNQKSDDAGRQISLNLEMYPTDVLNILTESGGFILLTQSSAPSGEISWSLQKWWTVDRVARRVLLIDLLVHILVWILP